MRPWLLIPKVICAGVALGSAVSALVLWWRHGEAMAPPDLRVTDDLHLLLGHVLAPALAIVVLLGVGLWLQHPRVFLRQRWLQAKLGVAILALPALHLMTSCEVASRRAAGVAWSAERVQSPLGGLLGAAALVLALLIVLGRLKPRLGRGPGRQE